MIVSFLILKGFQDTVKNKIYNFSAHLQVKRYSLNSSVENDPIPIDNFLLNNYQEIDFVEHVQPFAHLVGIVKRDEDLSGVVFKGVDRNYDRVRFEDNLVSGRFIAFDSSTYSKEILVSKILVKY